MQISFSELQNTVDEFNTPYTLHTCGDEEKKLLDRMSAEDATPFEFCDYIYRQWGPDKFVRNVLVSDKVWNEFVNFRNVRRNENKIKTDLEKHRMKYLLDKGVNAEEIITSELETFLVLFKYVVAKASGLHDLAKRFEGGARYELRTMPELKKYLTEFREEHFPNV
jgi:hypothetical protein